MATSNTDLKGFIDRAKSLIGEIAALQEDMGELCREAKEAGHNPKILKRAAKIAASGDAAKVSEEIKKLSEYCSAAGVQLSLGL